jgi:hypothetical protein
MLELVISGQGIKLSMLWLDLAVNWEFGYFILLYVSARLTYLAYKQAKES